MNTLLRSKKLLIPLVLASVLVIATLIYALWWRPSDADYQSATGLATYVEKTHRVLTVELSTMLYPAEINAATPLKLGVLANSYKAAVDTLNQNATVGRDFKVKSVYDRHRSTLTEHSQSMVKLASSIKLYTTILEKCQAYTNSIERQKTDTYTSLLDACHTALSKGTSAEHKEFKDLFLTKYIEHTTNYVDSLDKIFSATAQEDLTATQKSADTAYQALNKLGEIKLKFESPNVIAITKDLTTILDSQKKALLR